MFVPKPSRRQRLRAFVNRLDRAAAAVNPILTLITIGLVLIDLISLCSVLDRKYATAAFWAYSPQIALPRVTVRSDGPEPAASR